MAELPAPGPPPSPQRHLRPRRRPKPPLPLLLAGGMVAGSAAVMLSLDRLAAQLYGRWRPDLERQLSTTLGHTLQLGPYQGLGWSGLEIGPSRLLPQPSDPSQARIGRIGVSLDLLSSLRRRLPVLQLSLSQVAVELRRNPKGGYWQLGRMPPGQSIPRLDARLRLLEPARVLLPDSGLELAALGSAALQPQSATLSGQLNLGLAQAAGSPLRRYPLVLRGGGNWRQGRWQAQLWSRDLALEPLARSLAVPGQLRGSLDGRLQLAWRSGRPDCQGALQLQGASWKPPGSQPPLALADLPLQCQGLALQVPDTAWRWGDRRGRVALKASWQGQQLALERLDLRTGRSWLRARGRLAGDPLLAGDWQLEPRDLPLQAGTPLALLGGPVRGTVSLGGSWRQPRLRGLAAQGGNPLLGPWQARLAWAEQRLVLDDFTSPHLRARGSLPLRFAAGGGVQSGLLDLQLTVLGYPLERLGPLFGTQLGGQLAAEGTIRGPLEALTPAFRLQLSQLRAGPLQLAERWQGDWFGQAAGGGLLQMQPEGGQGRLEARLDRRWVPVAMDLERAGGRLSLAGTPKAYRWQAQTLPLGGLAAALGPARRFQALQGSLSGQGVLELQPLAFRGQVTLRQASVLGVVARELRLEGRYGSRRYQARGEITPQSGGSLSFDWGGQWQGAYRASLSGRGLQDGLVRQLLEAWPRWHGRPGPDPGRAADLAGADGAIDLGTLLLDQFGSSIDLQLKALNRARARVLEGRRQQQQLSPAERLEQVAARFDLEATLQGPRLLDTRVDGQVRGHLWLPGEDRDAALTARPMELTLAGPLRLGDGTFSLSGVPLALLALLTPVPAELRGSLALRGRYRLAAEPQLGLTLALEDAGLGATDLLLERGSVNLDGDQLDLDLALRAAGADSGIDLAGRVPLDPRQDGVELRLSSRDAGLIFLSRLAQPALTWKEGSADLQLLVRGSVSQPVANGFLRLQNGTLTLLDQPVQDLQAMVLFDFEQLFLQDFSARVGEKGKLAGSGSLGLLTPQRTSKGEEARLRLTLTDLPFRFPRVRAVTNGELEVGGSLAALAVTGELGLAKGSINVQPSRLAVEGDPASGATSVATLAEERWAFNAPLVLYGPDVESATSEQLRALIPNLNRIRFQGLRLSLGPDLAVTVPGLANFQTQGSLQIDGPLDPSIQARGVVRLNQGRLGLFTTTFSLDPGAPNVAVFTPSLGLIPFLDITLRTRVSDSLNAGGVYSDSSSGAQQLSPSLAQLESQGGINSLNQLNLVRVYLTVSGPADRLADNIRLRSSPPLPEDRLIALIGGNTLAGVVGSGAGAALATVVGQSLLSPILGTLGDAFGQRLSLAIYPAYVNQAVPRGSEQRSQRVPPQLVVATELGLDISERFNASVLAAPNVDNVPPQLNLTIKASELLNLQGSIDTEGSWQTQLQVFFRF